MPSKKSAKKKKNAEDDGRQWICRNRRALRDYAVTDKLEAGLVLRGTEVKSCRAGKASLNDAYVRIDGNEAFLVNSNIAEYPQANRFNHEPDRKRKLLLSRREIDRLAVRLRERGLVAIPLSFFFRNGYVKTELGVGKGRTHEDRRELVKNRESQREIDRALRRGRR